MAKLDQLGVDWRRESLTEEGKRRGNLMTDLGGVPGWPLLLVWAHFDQVQMGHGATDNASGGATVLALAEALHDRPPGHQRV